MAVSPWERVHRREPRPSGPNAWPPDHYLGGWKKGSIAARPGRTVRMPGPQVVTWGVRGRAHRRAPIYEGARLFRSHREQMWKSRNSSFGELSPFRTILQARAGQGDTSFFIIGGPGDAHIPDGDDMLAEPNPKGFRHYQSSTALGQDQRPDHTPIRRSRREVHRCSAMDRFHHWIAPLLWCR